MATGKVAIASVMDTVTATANSVSALIHTTTKGIGMLDAIVTKASNEQQARHKVAAHTFVKNLIRDSAEEQAIADMQVINFCAKSADHKQMFEKNFNEISELFAPVTQSSD